jgi:hypothetical protein
MGYQGSPGWANQGQPMPYGQGGYAVAQPSGYSQQGGQGPELMSSGEITPEMQAGDPMAAQYAGTPGMQAEGVAYDENGQPVYDDPSQCYPDGCEQPSCGSFHCPMFSWQTPPNGSRLIDYLPLPYAGLAAQDGCDPHMLGNLVTARNGQIYGRVDALMMRRSGVTGGIPLIVRSATVPPVELLDSSQLHFKNEVGQRATVGLAIDERNAIEVTYWSLQNPVATNGITVPVQPLQVGTLSLPGDIPGAVNGGGNAFNQASAINITYGTQLYNVEANYLVKTVYDKFSLLAGFRTIQLQDRMTFTTKTLNFGNGFFDQQMRDGLYGGQLGFLFRKDIDLFAFELIGKSGLYCEHVRSTSLGYSPGLPLTGVNSVRDADVNNNNTSFVQDFQLNGTYNFTSSMLIRLGYQVMWLDHVALAPNNLDFTHVVGSGTTISHGADLFYYGMNLGFEARF